MGIVELAFGTLILLVVGYAHGFVTGRNVGMSSEAERQEQIRKEDREKRKWIWDDTMREVNELRAAVYRWLPMVDPAEIGEEAAAQAANDAYLTCGLDEHPDREFGVEIVQESMRKSAEIERLKSALGMSGTRPSPSDPVGGLSSSGERLA